jgi:putative membrane protein
MTQGAPGLFGRRSGGRSRWSLRLLVVVAAGGFAALPSAPGWAVQPATVVTTIKPATVAAAIKPAAVVRPADEVQPVRAGDTPVAPDANGKLPAGWKNTQWGPFGPADQALLEQVRRADLWEGEGAAVMGMQKGDSEKVRDVGKALNEQHAKLEIALKKVAGQLQVTLPTQPNADQQGWLGEMAAASGPDFDKVWVARLRAAHGKIFSVLATVRANTRNSLVRDFATTGNNVVATHMQLLESTGLVQFNDLPTPVAPTTAAPGALAAGVAAQHANGNGGMIRPVSSASGGLSPVIIYVVLALSIAAGGMVLLRVLRAR